MSDTLASAEHYAARVRAADAQRARRERFEGSRWDRYAPEYRFDPRRPLDGNLDVLASFVKPDDVVVDVGGGAGRIALPLALRCREVINAEPSRGMGDEFLDLARSAGITNARLVTAPWLEAGAEGDVVLTVDVTYFVADIVPFLRKLDAAARRRVIIWTWDVPPPSLHAALYELVHGEPLALVPDYRDLLAVLWDLGILPEVRLLPEPFEWPVAGGLPRTREDAITFALNTVGGAGVDGARERVETSLDQLFAREGGVFVPAWEPRTRGLLITWEPERAG